MVRAVHGGIPGPAGNLADVPEAPFELVTVAINFPDEEAGVRKFLEAQHATTKNLLFGTTDPYELMKVVDPDWNGAVPSSMVIAPGGKVLFKGNGTLDVLKTRRLILASFPDDGSVGQNAYWNSKYKRQSAERLEAGIEGNLPEVPVGSWK